MNGRPLTITLHVVTSLDGFIATRDGDVSWLGTPDDEYERGVDLSDAQVAEVLAGIDAYVLGSRTYETACELGWLYGETPVIVMTNRALTSERASVEFHGGDLQRLVRDELAPRFENVWLAGGASLAQSFLALDLGDRMILTTAPITLGGGVRLFGAGGEQRWRLTDSVAFKPGYVESTYEAVRK